MNSKDVGERTEGLVLAQLLKNNETVLLPFGDNQRYDLVIERDGEFIRIQCKTGRLVGCSIEFKTHSSQAHRGKGERDYRGQADLFGVYCPETDKVYLVPVDEVGLRVCSMRVVDTPGSSHAARYAADFEI